GCGGGGDRLGEERGNAPERETASGRECQRAAEAVQGTAAGENATGRLLELAAGLARRAAEPARLGAGDFHRCGQPPLGLRGQVRCCDLFRRPLLGGRGELPVGDRLRLQRLGRLDGGGDLRLRHLLGVDRDLLREQAGG